MELASEIKKLKAQRDAVILVHNYQRPEIHAVADHLGDSLALAKLAAEVTESTIVFCGVSFMAETAKILSPEKTVLQPRRDTPCPMADMVTAEELAELKAQHPDAQVVCYVNTNGDVKALSDVCCTSANAVKIVNNIPAQKIIFVPDRNLAAYCQRFTDKEIIPWNGYCNVHDRITVEEIDLARKIQPEAVLLVHPECRPEIIDLADEVLSTEGMVQFAKKSDKKHFLIGTEEGLIHRLQRENPEKSFYAAGNPKYCATMKRSMLEDVHLALKENRYQVEVPPQIIAGARKSLDRMLEFS